MSDMSVFGLATAFIAGIASFLSPCVLPLVPGYLSYVAATGPDAQSPSSTRLRSVVLSAFFVLGFALVFVALGASITVLGRIFLAYRHELTMLSGALVVAAGIIVMGVIPLPGWAQRYWQPEFAARGGSPSGATLLGMAFGFGWTPCIGPVLAAILTLSATAEHAGRGALLLAVYAAGLGIPFLMAAALLGPFTRRIRSLKTVGKYFQLFAGLVLVAMGIAVITGDLGRLALWFLKVFPALGRVG